MRSCCLSARRGKLIATALSLLLTGSSTAEADTLLSGFEGDLSSAIGTDWEFYDPEPSPAGDQTWPHQFVTEGATEGTQALHITHFSDWSHGFALKPTTTEARMQLIDLFANNSSLEFDVTTPAGISWRQIFVIVNSSATEWSQVQLEIPANATTHMVMPLTNPDPGDATKNWKQAAIDGGPAATYWEIFVALQGDDLPPTADFDFDMDVDGSDFLILQQNIGNMAAGQEQGDTNFDAIVDGVDLEALRTEFGRSAANSSTTIDNIRFVSGAGLSSAVAAIPEPSTLACVLIGGGATAMAARRRRCR